MSSSTLSIKKSGLTIDAVKKVVTFVTLFLSAVLTIASLIGMSHADPILGPSLDAVQRGLSGA